MNGLLFFLSILGVFHGFILSLYLFIFTKKKTLSKYLLGALILALSIRIGKSVLLYFNPELPKYILQIGLSGCIFIGPLLYFYLKSVITETKIIPLKWKLILLALLIFIIVGGVLRPYETYPAFWNAVMIKIIYAIWFLGLVSSSILIFPALKKGISSWSSVTSQYKWLLAVFFCNAIIASAFFLVIAGFSNIYYITGPLVFSFFIYLLAFGYFNNQWFEDSENGSLEKYQNKKIDEADADELLKRLGVIMTQKELYTNPNFKLNDLAQELAIPKHQLSQLLNDNLGKSFKTYINEYRIDSACRILVNDHQLSLEGIGYEVGFRSKSSFYTSFKKFKGLTPTQYLQQNVQ